MTIIKEIRLVCHILAGPEEPGKKTSKFGLKQSKAQDKNNVISNRIDMSVLITDC
jgi:hypothetical protein